MNHLIKAALKFVVAISAVVAISSPGWARSSGGDGVLLSLNPYYGTSSDDALAGTPTTNAYTSTTTLLDINLGYQMAAGLYLGALYFTDTGASTNPTGATSNSGYGVSAGYMKNGWFGHLHYILSADKDDNTANADKWSKGTGIQVDLGYMMPVSGAFMLGVELAYRSLSYSTNTVSSVESTTTARKTADMMPKIRFTFIF